MISATPAVASAILLEAALSFLGVWGVPPTTATWVGKMVAGRAGPDHHRPLWWLYVFPGVAIMLTVLSVNAFGDWLRDALDPTQRRVRA